MITTKYSLYYRIIQYITSSVINNMLLHLLQIICPDVKQNSYLLYSNVSNSPLMASPQFANEKKNIAFYSHTNIKN